MARSGSSKSSKSSKSMGIDLTMVLLAVFVGLLVCSYMKGSLFSTDIVEGAVNAIPTNGGVCRGVTASQDALCAADPSARDETTCGGSGDVTGGVCAWHNHNDTYSYSGGLEGTVYNDWMMALGLMNARAVPSPDSDDNPLKTFKKTSMIPLGIKGRTPGGAVGSPSPPTEYVAGPSSQVAQSLDGVTYDHENFLAHIGVITAKDAINNPYIPDALESEVSRQVARCESGWDKDGYKDSYAANGGRPIMGYSASEGLVCRNPLYYPVVLQGSEARIWLGQEGDAPNNLGGCPDPTANAGGCEKRSSRCSWESSDGYAEAMAGGLYNNLPLTSGGECGLDSCAAQYPQQCAKTNLVAAAKDGGSWIVNNIPGVPQIA